MEESFISPRGIYVKEIAINQHLSEITYRIQAALSGNTSRVPTRASDDEPWRVIFTDFSVLKEQVPRIPSDKRKLFGPLRRRGTSHSYSEEPNPPPRMWQPCRLHQLHLLTGVLSLHTRTQNWRQDVSGPLLYDGESHQAIAEMLKKINTWLL